LPQAKQREGLPKWASILLWILRLGLLHVFMFAGGNLLLGFNFPGALYIEDFFFNIVVFVFLWLTEEPQTLPIVAAIAVVLGIVAFAVRRRVPIVWHLFGVIVSLVVLAGQVGFIMFGLLMEKEIAVAVLGGLLLLVARSRLDRNFLQPESTRIGFGGKLLLGLLTALCLYYIYSLLYTDPQGYLLLRWLNRLVSDTSNVAVILKVLLFVFVVAANLVAAFFFCKIQPRRRVLATTGVALLVSIILFVILLARNQAATSCWYYLFAVTVMTLVLQLAVLLHRRGFAMLPMLYLDPRRYPRRLVVLAVLALLCMMHAYAFRVFGAEPQPSFAPYLTKLDDAPEVFRAVLDPSGDNLYLVYRTRGQVVRYDLDTGQQTPIDPGPLSDVYHPDSLRFPGVPEDLIYLADRDLLLATYALDPDHQRLFEQRQPGVYNDIIPIIDPSINRVVDSIAIPDLCWINSIRWHASRQTLYIGCEDRREMLAYDLDARRVLRHERMPSVGDIQDLEIDDRREPSELYTISLWYSPYLSALAADDWRVLRRRMVGGANYEMAFAPSDELLFVGRFYESRVVAVDAQTFQPERYLRTGFGTRALAVYEPAGVLLASSLYDGAVRVFNYRTGELIDALFVGGHVKSIALDQQRGIAYFGNRRAIYRFALQDFLEARGVGR